MPHRLGFRRPGYPGFRVQGGRGSCRALSQRLALGMCGFAFAADPAEPAPFTARYRRPSHHRRRAANRPSAPLRWKAKPQRHRRRVCRRPKPPPSRFNRAPPPSSSPSGPAGTSPASIRASAPLSTRPSDPFTDPFGDRKPDSGPTIAAPTNAVATPGQSRAAAHPAAHTGRSRHRRAARAANAFAGPPRRPVQSRRSPRLSRARSAGHLDAQPGAQRHSRQRSVR